MKTCIKCTRVKPASEFYRAAHRSDGLQNTCKACQISYKTKWNAENHGRVLAGVEAYDAANKEKRAAWRSANPEKIKAQAARHYAKSYAADPEKWREKGRSRRLLKVGFGGERLPPGTVPYLFEQQNGWCPCCGADLTETGYHLDHVVALAKGGEHVVDNLQLLAPSCNLSKGAKDWEDHLNLRWRQQHLTKGE